MELSFEAYKEISFIIFFSLYKDNTNNHYQKHKEKLRKEIRKKYQNL